MRQEFLDELDIAGNNRDKLLRLMAALGEEKRSIKACLRRLSSEAPVSTLHAAVNAKSSSAARSTSRPS